MALEFVGMWFRSSQAANASFTVDLTQLAQGIDTAAREGDVVVVAYGCVSTADRALSISTAGYTEEAELYRSDSRDVNLAVAWKRMGATPDTSVTIAAMGGSSTEGAAAQVHVWRGVDADNPMDVLPTTATGINSAVPNCPSITPVTQGAEILACGGGTGASTSSPTAPTGYDKQGVAASDPGTAITIAICRKAWDGSGAEDPAAWTNWATSNSDSWAAVTLALRPAPSGTGVLPGTGALDATGFAPAIAVSDNQVVAPGVGVLDATGFAPSVVASDYQNVQPGVGALDATGFVPTVQTPVTVTAGVGALTADGFAPTVNIGTNVLTDAGALDATGFAASVTVSNNQNVPVGVGALDVAGFAPSVATTDNQNVLVGVGALQATGFAPSVQTPVNVLVDVGALIAQGFAPIILTVAPPDVGLGPLSCPVGNGSVSGVSGGPITVELTS